MANSASFDGLRITVKVPWQTLGHLFKAAGDLSRESTARDWMENWRTLAGLSPFLYKRLVYAAQKRRLPLAAIVNEALTRFSQDLEDPPEGEKIETLIDILDQDWIEKEATEKGSTAKKSRK